MEIKNVIGESIVCVKLFNIVNDFGKKKITEQKPMND